MRLALALTLTVFFWLAFIGAAMLFNPKAVGAYGCCMVPVAFGVSLVAWQIGKKK